MEEDGAVKAPVTRLRRRLSVEQSEDTMSPSAPSTPTKKKGRLAAKPQLELIAENAPQNSPAKRTTRKSISRDIVEPVEEKVLTPARRSTRIRSNSSILSETSTIQKVDTPRAARAARRYSQTGSDNEAPTTPARVTRRTRRDSTSSMDKSAAPANDTPVKTPARTRRTRKDSTSSIDKQGDSEVSSSQSQNFTPDDHIAPKIIITEVIAEEPESELRKSPTSDPVESRKSSSNSSPVSLRKSPRIQAKKNKTDEPKHDSSDVLTQENEVKKTEKNEEKESKNEIKQSQSSDVLDGQADENTQVKLSSSCSVMLEAINIKPTNKNSNLNKSMPVIEKKNNSNSKRHRTKSWSALVKSTKNEENFYSDNESVKKKLKKHEKVFSMRLNSTGSGDCLLKNANQNKDDTLDENYDVPNKETKSVNTSNDSNKENFTKHDASVTELLFQKAPSEDMQSMVFIEDSDTDSLKQINTQMEMDDQCVPTVPEVSVKQNKSIQNDTSLIKDDMPNNQVINIFVNNNANENNDTCEPMDIDETIPENITLDDSAIDNQPINESVTQNIEQSNKSKRKSSISNLIKSEEIHQNITSSPCKAEDISTNEKLNKSNRKSSITNQSSREYVNTSTSNAVALEEEKSEKISRTSSLSIPSTDISLTEKINKSKRKSSVTNKDLETSHRKSSTSQNDEKSEKNSRTSSLSIVDADERINEKSNKSKRKSSITNITSQDIESKSTLVLSQIKDSSSVIVSPKSVEEPTEISKSLNIPITKDIPLNHNISLNCLTSTPVQQKDVKKLVKQNNTPVVTPENSRKNQLNDFNLPPNSKHDNSTDSDSSSSNEESSQDRSNMFDDEAEEASKDYESGDSQDEEERQYAKDHEIIDKGVTLTSEEEESDDMDYEKDSFVVSSDNEDNELLSGSGDDLGMSDNELTMSAKSKQKYDERMRKKQKKASKEMYEARHASKNNQSRLDSTQESEPEIMAPPKKNKRMRLDSNWDSSVGDESELKNKGDYSDTSEIGKKKKNKSKRLSESMNENTMNEEIEMDIDTKNTTTSEIGHKKKKKSKRLSESDCESTLDNHDLNKLKNETSVLDDSVAGKIKSGKKEKVKKVSEPTSDDVIEDNETNSHSKDVTIDNSTITNDKKKKKSKRLSESVCETAAEVVNDSQTEATYNGSTNGEIKKKNKKKKQLSESVTNDSVMNENEITIVDNSVMNKEDPLLIKVKQEPQTPMKDLDISTVNFTTREDIEEVKIDENISMLKSNETSDPLSNDGNNESEVSSLSENEDAMKNYDDILSQLNKGNKKIKTHDISLNLEKKNKKAKIPVMDQLNITQTKKEKKSVGSIKNKNKTSSVRTNQSDEEATSDSIDLKLLFSEDSNDSSLGCTKKTENKDTEIFIPLKRTEGKTNISVNASAAVQDTNMSLTKSATKKKKSRKSSQTENTTDKNEDNIFFIDTVGTRVETAVTSPKKNDCVSRKSNNKTELSDDESNDEPLEVPYSRNDNKKQEILLENQPTSPAKFGKKKKNSTSSSGEKTESSALPQNISLSKSQKKIKETSDSTTAALVNKETSKPEEKRGQKRKRELSPALVEQNISEKSMGNSQTSSQVVGSTEKRIKKQKTLQNAPQQSNVEDDIASKIPSLNINTQKPETKKSKKRKHRDEDDAVKVTKIAKENSMEKISVARLPSSILTQLEDKPKKEIIQAKKAKVISTTDFIVQESVPKRLKPSNYLEESVYLNDDSDSPPKKKTNHKKPKVLPFIPTASTSDCGFTTKFQVNVIPQKVEFVAKASTTADFRTEYLRNRRMKKMRTYQLHKQNRNIILTKY